MTRKIISIALSIVLLSCKKDSKAPANTSNGTPTYYGVFISEMNVLITNTLVSQLNSLSSAYISSTQLINYEPLVGTLVDAGNVSLNGTTFKKNAWGAPNLYQDTTYSGGYSIPHIWSISGSSAIPAFTFTNTNNYPVYTGYSSIQDSIVVSQGVSVPITNVSGADNIKAYFTTVSGTSTLSTMKYVSGNVSSINFTAADLSAIGTNSNVALSLEFFKNNEVVINNNNYNFRTAYAIFKTKIKFK